MAPAFNNSRVRDHGDKLLVARVSEYFEAFANADADKMDSMVAPDYRMSDICKSCSIFSLLNHYSNTLPFCSHRYC
jgi:hypothetical protein